MPQDINHNGLSEQIDAAAAEWVARADRAPLNDGDRRSLEEWLAASSRHRGAYARAQAAFAFMDARLAHEVAKQDEEARSMSRRRILWAGGGVAAAAAAASVAVFTFGTKAPVVNYSAQRGQIRLVSLGDGSLITLDTASKVAVQDLGHSRNVQLVAGRALFNVASDKSRPFVVTAGDLKVRSVAASFAVRHFESDPLEVLVQEGTVDVGRAAEKQAIQVGANMRVIASASAHAALNVLAVDPAALARELVWRQGLIAFEDVSLALAAAEFQRYSDTRIIIPDPTVASVTITGLFAANNPVGFAHAAALSLGLQLETEGDNIRLVRL